MIANVYDKINLFLEASTIHGLVYLGKSNHRCTKIIWLPIVLFAFSLATYFLVQTICSFNTKFTITTTETRSIKDYPFPAITFHPGEYNSEKMFLRTFLNQFKFTRFGFKHDKEKLLENNGVA